MLYKPTDLQVNGVNLVDLSVETRSIPLKMASRMVSTSFLMAISLAIFCVSRAQSQEQYCKKNLKYFQNELTTVEHTQHFVLIASNSRIKNIINSYSGALPISRTSLDLSFEEDRVDGMINM